MRVIAKPVEMVYRTDVKGNMRPIRFRYKEGDSSSVIPVDTVQNIEYSKKGVESTRTYTCSSLIDDRQVDYELRFNLQSCCWMLFRM